MSYDAQLFDESRDPDPLTQTGSKIGGRSAVDKKQDEINGLKMQIALHARELGELQAKKNIEIDRLRQEVRMLNARIADVQRPDAAQ